MESNTYPRIKNALLLCLLFLGIQIGSGCIFGIITNFSGINPESIVYGIGIIVLQLLSFGVAILIGFKKSKQKCSEVFKFNTVSLDIWLATIVFMIGFVIILSELDNILDYFLPMPQFLQDTFEILMVKQAFITSIVLIGIIPGITEELFFRGVILNGFQKNYSERTAILISALLFGVIHLNPWQFLTAFIIGIFSAWICIKTKSIVLCIYIHLFNNILIVIGLEYKDILPIKGFNTAYYEKTFQPLWFDMIGMLVTLSGILLLAKSIRKREISSNNYLPHDMGNL
jgi:membrane protease YdiL (CAAX protease family)